jgi:hypothetical protein
VQGRSDGAQGSLFWFTFPYRPHALCGAVGLTAASPPVGTATSAGALVVTATPVEALSGSSQAQGSQPQGSQAQGPQPQG